MSDDRPELKEPFFYETELGIHHGSILIYDGISDGQNHYFTLKQGKEIIKNFDTLNMPPGHLQYNKKTDRFVYKHEGKKVYFPGEDLLVSDGYGTFYKVRAYPIGTGVWKYKECIKDWEPVDMWKCPYCGEETDEPQHTCDACGHEVNF